MPPVNRNLRKKIVGRSYNRSINLELAQESNSLAWTGDLTPQKWTQLYTNVLSKFSTNKSVNLNIQVTITVDVDISEQIVNETIAGLKDLGLNFDLR